jgi:hypothetical protein
VGHILDTSVAHFSGTLGKPVWVLVTYIPDWRWLLDRDDSPWYPTARLFRQPLIDDWESAIIEALRTFIKNWKPWLRFRRLYFRFEKIGAGSGKKEMSSPVRAAAGGSSRHGFRSAITAP